MLDEWVPVSEDLPPLERGCKNVSRDVEILLATGDVAEGYYAYHQHRWLTTDSKPVKGTVIGWRTPIVI